MIPDEKEYKTRVTLTSLSPPMSSPTLGTHTLTNDQGPKIGPRINLTWRWIVQHSNPVCMEVCNGSQCGWKGVWYWARWCTLSSTQSWNNTWFSPVFWCSMNSCRDRIGIGIRHTTITKISEVGHCVWSFRFKLVTSCTFHPQVLKYVRHVWVCLQMSARTLDSVGHTHTIGGFVFHYW